MASRPIACGLEDLLEIERERPLRSVWILDSAEVSFDISVEAFIDVLAANVIRGLEYRWILPEGLAAREYWLRLREATKQRVQDPSALMRLQSRFLPPGLLQAMSDFVLYDAKTMARFGHVGILQDGEYWHFEVNPQKLADLAAGFEFLWKLPKDLESVIFVYASGRDDLGYFLPSGLLPEDVTRSVNENYEEILKVFRAGCRTAAIGLCGRLIETVLYALYHRLEGSPPEEAWGLDALSSRLKKQGVFLPAIQEQFSLVKKFRNKAVHGGISFPTEQQAEAVVLLTRDLLAQVVDRLVKGG